MEEEQKKQDDEAREQWKVRSYVEVYSASKKSWFAGQITQIRGEKISIRYYANGWRDKNVKRASKTAVRPLKSKESLTALTERIAEAREAKQKQAQQEKEEREKELALVKKKAEEAGKLEAERLKKKAQKSGIELGDPVKFTYKGIVQTGTVKDTRGKDGKFCITLTKGRLGVGDRQVANFVRPCVPGRILGDCSEGCDGAAGPADQHQQSRQVSTRACRPRQRHYRATCQNCTAVLRVDVNTKRQRGRPPHPQQQSAGGGHQNVLG